MFKRWDGAMVCKKDFETRHEQEFIRPVKERTIPWSRPEPQGIDVSPDAFFYIEAGYWERPSVVPPAGVPDNLYTGNT